MISGRERERACWQRVCVCVGIERVCVCAGIERECACVGRVLKVGLRVSETAAVKEAGRERDRGDTKFVNFRATGYFKSGEIDSVCVCV